METVFLLWHTGPADSDETAMLIGVFSSEQQAKDAIVSVANKPGFVNYPDRFEICPYEVGRVHWSEGFAIPQD